MLQAYRSKRILYDQAFLDGWLLVEAGKVLGIETRLPKCPIVDYQDKIIAPGLVDTHIHGYGGKDVMDLEPGALDVISQGLVTGGVTAFLATTLTQSTEDIAVACSLINQEADGVRGAKVAGIFLEGPFFTDKHKGAQNPAHMIDPDMNQVRKWQALSGGRIRKLALAPERRGSLDFIRQVKSLGIEVALGHSDATGEEALAAVRAGANIFVHLYNGMSPLHHRSPGMVGACLASDAYAELICDGHHVHPLAAQVAIKAKGKEGIILISDCMRAGGMDEGVSRLGDFEVTVKEGAARLTATGALAGSILTLVQAVSNVVSWGLADLSEALKMASYYPAKSLGLQGSYGLLKKGCSADFIVLSPDLDLLATYVDGRKVY